MQGKLRFKGRAECLKVSVSLAFSGSLSCIGDCLWDCDCEMVSKQVLWFYPLVFMTTSDEQVGDKARVEKNDEGLYFKT